LHLAKKKDKLKTGPNMLIGFTVNDLDYSVKEQEKKCKIFQGTHRGTIWQAGYYYRS
jgi:hypothetical protein